MAAFACVVLFCVCCRLLLCLLQLWLLLLLVLAAVCRHQRFCFVCSGFALCPCHTEQLAHCCFFGHWDGDEVRAALCRVLCGVFQIGTTVSVGAWNLAPSTDISAVRLKQKHQLVSDTHRVQ